MSDKPDIDKTRNKLIRCRKKKREAIKAKEGQIFPKEQTVLIPCCDKL